MPDRNARDKYSIESLKDYCFCPLYFGYKQNGNLMETKGDVVCTQCLRRTAYYIMYNMQHESLPRNVDIKKTFSRLLSATLGAKKAKVLPANIVARSLEQALAMREFYKARSQRQMMPVLINYEYALEVKQNIVTGQIDGILANKNDMELLILVNNLKTNKTAMSRDIEVITACMACKYLTNKQPNLITIYNINTGVSESVKLTPLDVKTTEACISSIIKAIQNDIYYPSVDRDCANCSFNSLCKSGKWLTIK